MCPSRCIRSGSIWYLFVPLLVMWKHIYFKTILLAYRVTRLSSCPGSSLRAGRGLIHVCLLHHTLHWLRTQSELSKVLLCFLVSDSVSPVMLSRSLPIMTESRTSLPVSSFVHSTGRMPTQFREHLFHIRPWTRCWGMQGSTKYSPVVLERWHCPHHPPSRQVTTHSSLLHWWDLSSLPSASTFNTLVPNNRGPAIVSWTTQCQVSEASSKWMCLLPDCMFGYYQQFPRNKTLTEGGILVVRRPGGRKVSGLQCHSRHPMPHATVGVPHPIVLGVWAL